MKSRLFVFFANIVVVPIGLSIVHIGDQASKGNLVGYLSWWQHQWLFALTVGTFVGGIQFLTWPWVMKSARKA